MTTDLSHRAFRAHAAQQLASSATLRNSVLHQLYSRLSHRTMTTIDAATLRFAYAPGEEPFLIVGYSNQATIALPQYWMELSELCWEPSLSVASASCKSSAGAQAATVAGSGRQMDQEALQ
jgi:hypothetical protein